MHNIFFIRPARYVEGRSGGNDSDNDSDGGNDSDDEVSRALMYSNRIISLSFRPALLIKFIFHIFSLACIPFR